MPFVLANTLAAGSLANPALIDASLSSGRIRHQSAEFNYAADAIGTYTAPIVLPRGARVLFGYVNTSVTLGATATVAIGITGTVGKYRAAAVLTTADAPVLLGLNAITMAELQLPEQIIMTVAAAALPGSGRMVLGFLYSLD
jgi:hypothetical protein